MTASLKHHSYGFHTHSVYCSLAAQSSHSYLYAKDRKLHLLARTQSQCVSNWLESSQARWVVDHQGHLHCSYPSFLLRELRLNWRISLFVWKWLTFSRLVYRYLRSSLSCGKSSWNYYDSSLTTLFPLLKSSLESFYRYQTLSVHTWSIHWEGHALPYSSSSRRGIALNPIDSTGRCFRI